MATTAVPGPADEDATTTAPAPAVGGEAEPVALLSDTVERTAAFETARFEVVVAADPERLTGLNPVGPLRATGELADFGAALRMEMVVESVGDVTQTIVDGVAYTEAPRTGCASVELPETPLAGAYTGSLDPAMFLQQLRAVGEVSDLGPHDIRGVATTHLAGSFTARAALELATTDGPSSVEELGVLPPRRVPRPRTAGRRVHRRRRFAAPRAGRDPRSHGRRSRARHQHHRRLTDDGDPRLLRLRRRDLDRRSHGLQRRDDGLPAGELSNRS